MSVLAFKPNLEEVLARLGRLYRREATGEIFASFEFPSAALEQFGLEHQTPFCDYPDPRDRLRFWERHLAQRAAVEDDSVPCAYLSEFDQGLYGGLCGGDVRFMAHPENGWISSMVPPLLHDWSQFDSLAFSPASPWFETYVRQLEIFAAGAQGRFGVSHFILIDGLNFAYELVGATQTYLALAERPATVRRVIDFAFHLNLEVQKAFFNHVPLLQGGTVSNMAQWIPGRIVSESVDPFHMTSVKYFEEWGREPVERMFRQFDGGVLHLHGNGRHLLSAVSRLPGLKALFLGDDRGYPPAIDVLPALRARAGDLPLVTQASFPVFLDHLARHELPGGVFYRVHGAPDVAAANRAMEEVRRYRL